MSTQKITAGGHFQDARHVNRHPLNKDFDQTLPSHGIKKTQTKCLIRPCFTRALTEGKQTKGSRCRVGGVYESSHLSAKPAQAHQINLSEKTFHSQSKHILRIHTEIY